MKEDLNRVLDGKPSDRITSDKAMRNGELAQAIIPPEASGARISNNLLQFPWRLEGCGLDLPITGDGAPKPANASGTGQIGDRKLLEDDPESISASQAREVGIHRRNRVSDDDSGGFAIVGGGDGGDKGFVEEFIVVSFVPTAPHFVELVR